VKDLRRVLFLAMLVPTLAAGLAAQHFSSERHRMLPNVLATRAVSGDFDGDGDQDLAMIVGSGFQSNLQIAWNDGQGRFTLGGAAYPVSFGPVVAFDMDGDGDLDLATGGNLSIGSYAHGVLLRNDGPAGFTDVSWQWPTTNEMPGRMLFLDYDGDGDLDLLTCNSFSNSAGQQGLPQPINRLYLNNGAGIFTDATASLMPNQPDYNTGMAVGDIDGDGDIDLVFCTQMSAPTTPGRLRVFVHQANGVAVETPGRVAAIPGFSGGFTDVALVDLDLDGDLDLVAASTQGVYLFTNDGTGHFALAGSIPDTMVQTLDAHDFDRDGRVDLLAVRRDWIQERFVPLRMWRNTPGGLVDVTATAIEAPELAPAEVHVFDCDGDGDLDLWGAVYPQSTLWHNDGAGHLLQLCTRDLSNAAILFATVADVNGDGRIGAGIIEQAQNGGMAVSYVPGDHNGPGPRRIQLVAPDFSRRATCLQFLDVDGDGDLDLYVGIQGATSASANQDLLFHNNGGVFQDVTAAHMPVDLTPTTQVVAGDIDRDGVTDLVVAGSSMRIYRGDGVGGFSNVTGMLPATPAPVTGVAMIDFDGDGDLDIVQALSPWSSPQWPLRLLRNDWPAPFVDVTNGVLPSLMATAVATTDIDHDGRQDLLVLDPTAAGSSLRVFRSTGTGFVDETATRAPAFVWAYTSLTVADIDGDGWEDVLLYDERYGLSTQLQNVNGVLVPFPANSLYFNGSPPTHPAFGDFDADGDQDMITWFGTVKNRARDLEIAAPPRLGAGAELVLQAFAGDGVNPQSAALLLSPRLAANPLVLPGLGSLFLDPNGTWVHSWRQIPGTGGEASVQFQVPAQPSLLGATLYAQGLFLHQPGVATWRLGNPVTLSLRL
jgi:FG-GAP-like repeat